MWTLPIVVVVGVARRRHEVVCLDPMTAKRPVFEVAIVAWSLGLVGAVVAVLALVWLAVLVADVARAVFKVHICR